MQPRQLQHMYKLPYTDLYGQVVFVPRHVYIAAIEIYSNHRYSNLRNRRLEYLCCNWEEP